VTPFSDEKAFSAKQARSPEFACSATNVLEACNRISPFIHRTPVLTCSTLDEKIDASVFLKCENFQKTGSFKFRGACNAVASLMPTERKRGVYAHSSGNHAQALALAAKLHDIPAHIVMPENANSIKIEATRGYGAHITFCAPTHEARWETAERIGQETGATFVHPHDDPRVIAGQGTAVCELIEDAVMLDLVLAPLGGGGLLSGTLLAAKHLLPEITVIGCEPSEADDAARSIASGERIIDFTANTIADGLRTPLGENTFKIIRGMADDIVLVSETDIIRAMKFVWERMKIVIEPSAAVALAPLLNGTVQAKGKRVGVIISGGNVDLTEFFESLEAKID